MLKKFIILLLFPVITFASTDKYIIDKSHFAIGFLVEHVGYAKTLGMFREIDGNYSHDTENNTINDINIIIKTDSVFTNHDKRDEHLMSPDFLNVSKYPEMTFRANNIKIDNLFLSTVDQKIINNSEKTYNFYPYGQIIRNKAPQVTNFYILH